MQKIILLLSDAAPYAIKAGKMLKQIVPQLKHITCICHGIHNLCETVRNINKNVDRLISFLKSSLIKNREKQALFTETTDLALPKWPVLTRRSTWLSCAEWVFDNFTKLELFIKELSNKFPNIANDDILQLVNSSEFEKEILEVHSMGFLTTFIYKLETESLSTEDQVGIINDILLRISQKDVYLDSYKQILSRNPDFEFFQNFKSFKATENEKFYSFVPLTTVEIERTSSGYKDILSDKRRGLTVENIEKYLFIYFNSCQ